MRAFLRSSDGCFQLKPQTTTIGRHEGSDIVLKVWESCGTPGWTAGGEVIGWELEGEESGCAGRQLCH